MYTAPVIAADLDAIVEQALPWERLRSKTVLVTGASGMLGSYLTLVAAHANAKLDLGARVVAVGRSEASLQRALGDVPAAGGVEFLIADVREPLPLTGAADFVLHAASPAQPNAFLADPVGVIDANVAGSRHLLELVRASGGRLLFVSTREIYGEPATPGQNFREEDMGLVDPAQQRACYPESKRLAETLVAAYVAQHGVDAVIARLAHTYGPGMLRSDTRVQASFADRVLSGEDIVLKSTGELVRSYTYIGDAASGMFWALLTGSELVYNVANDEAMVSIRELAEIFLRASGNEAISLRFDLPDGSTPTGWSTSTGGNVVTERLRALGWKPLHSVASGVERWLEYLRSQ